MKARYVIDASVVAKWFLRDEEAEEEATTLLRRYRAQEISLIAPILLRYEVSNAIYQAVRRGRITVGVARSLLLEFGLLDLPLIDDGVNLMLLALDAAERYGCASLYDAFYLALAQAFDCKLISQDVALKQRAPSFTVSLADPL